MEHTLTKKRITDKEFEQARSTPANMRTINKVCNWFSGSLPPDTLHACGDIGLWRCLKSHKTGVQAFTSSLYTFVRWECLSAIQNETMKGNPTLCGDIEVLCGFTSDLSDKTTMLDEYLSMLPPIEREVLELRELGGHTLKEIADKKGYSKQGIKYMLERIMKFLEEKAQYRQCGV